MIKSRRPQASSGLLSLPQTRIPNYCFAKLLDFLGIYIYNSQSNHHCFSRNTAGCHLLMEDRFNNNLGLFLVFIQLQIIMYFHFLRQAQQPPPPPAPIQRPRRRHNMWVRPWLMQREEKGAYHNIMADLYATDIPGFTNYMRMTPEFFEMIKTRLEPHLARQATNYRAPISVGEKLALTIRYLATGESYTSLSCQFRVGRSTISKFLPEVCRAIQDEFTREYLKCPTTPDEWKELEREFRIRWNVPHALGALDGKHVALKKPKNTGALYHNSTRGSFQL